MCKRCVIQWNEAGKQMSKHLEGAFYDAVHRDMMTPDEEGMFFLLCFETGMHGFSTAMLPVLQSELIFEFMDSMMGVRS